MADVLDAAGNPSSAASQSYKTVKIPNRSPGVQEQLFVRYIVKDADGKRITGDRSAALLFTNNGLETKVFAAPTLTLTAQSFSYLVAWPKPSSSAYPNYLYTEIFESKTLSNFTAAQLSNPAVSGMGTFTSNSVVIPTGASLDLRYVKIRHVMSSNNVLVYSPLSNSASVTPTTPDASDQTPPDVPTGFAATGYNDSTDPSGNTGYVSLTWTASAAADVKGYTVKFGRSAAALDTYMTFGKVTSGRLDNLRSGITYYFAIASNDGVNNSAFTTTISASIPGDTTVPVAPTGLSAVAGLNNVIAYWNRNSETDVDLGRGTYQFQLSADNTFATTLYDKSGSATVASFTGLTTGTTYYIRVRAIDSTGNVGAWSSAASATPGKIDAQLSITGGTIVGDLIAGNTIVGEKIVSDSIDANRLKTNTALVGVLKVGSTNGITIDGNAADRAIYIGAGTYANANTQFYAANVAGVGKFSLGDKLTWDGANLSISGAVSITSNTTLGADLGIINSSGTIYLGATKTTANARILVNSGGIFAYPSGSTTANFALANDGTATFRNSITSGGSSTYPLVLDGANDRIIFNNGSPGAFTLDQDSETITTYTVTGYTDTGVGEDSFYGSYYSKFVPIYTTSLSEANTISLKRTAASTVYPQPSLILSTAGNGFLRISNKSSSSSADQSYIHLEDGGIEISFGTTGGLRIPNLNTTPHWSWSAVNGGFDYSTYQGTSYETGVSIVVKSDGTVSTGRAFYRSAASEASITTTSTVWPSVGRDGDILFSTGI